MSAIGLLPRSKSKFFISCHADYRREDFVFARTQSPAMRDMPWEHRARPLKSWDRLVYVFVGIGAAGAALGALL